jgi:hypothetical protein
MYLVSFTRNRVKSMGWVHSIQVNVEWHTLLNLLMNKVYSVLSCHYLNLKPRMQMYLLHSKVREWISSWVTLDYSRRDLLCVVNRKDWKTGGYRTASRYLSKRTVLKCWIDFNMFHIHVLRNIQTYLI